MKIKLPRNDENSLERRKSIKKAKREVYLNRLDEISDEELENLFKKVTNKKESN